MVRGEKIETVLHLSISVVINLILFTLLSIYLFVKTDGKAPGPIKVYIEEIPAVKEVEYAGGSQLSAQRTMREKGVVQKGREEAKASPMEVERKAGDVQVPAGKPEEEPSFLKEIEQSIKSRQAEKAEVKSEELGEMVITVSSGGIGLSGGVRATSHVPPFPKITSDEPLSPLKVRIWVEPSGVVSRVQIVQRSGSPQVDQKMVEFVKSMRFEPIKENILQTGVITFRFKGG